MRIVQLLQTLNIGGLERLAVDLALRQKLEGHEPSLYCTIQAGPLADVAVAAGIPVHVFGKTNGFSPRLICQLTARLRQDGADVLHAHNAMVLHYGIVAARLARVPVVVNTQHSSNLDSDPHLARLWARSVIYAGAVVFVSESARRHFAMKHCPSNRIAQVIFNGIDLEKFSTPAAPGSVPTRFRVGTVGRLYPVKDHQSLVRAFALVIRRLPGAELHILGEGPCRRQIEETATALGISDNVKLHGAGFDVATFLSQLDLFTLCSLEEGLPIALMEAMAAGLPIAATRLSSLPEVAPEGVVASYCRPGDPEALADLILRMARRPDLAAIGSKARELAQRFAIGRTWQQYHELFELLYGRKRSLSQLKAAGP